MNKIINFENKSEMHIKNAFLNLKERYRDVRFPKVHMRASLCTGFFLVGKQKL